MKLVKNVFLLSLFGFMLMMSMVLVFKRPNNNGVPIIPAALPTTNNKCIIVIDGGQYDVTDFKNRHLGGDIFACGTDMSTIFHLQHSDRFLNQMQGYKI